VPSHFKSSLPRGGSSGEEKGLENVGKAKPSGDVHVTTSTRNTGNLHNKAQHRSTDILVDRGRRKKGNIADHVKLLNKVTVVNESALVNKVRRHSYTLHTIERF
jgi:hypothetical protein